MESNVSLKNTSGYKKERERDREREITLFSSEIKRKFMEKR